MVNELMTNFDFNCIFALLFVNFIFGATLHIGMKGKI